MLPKGSDFPGLEPSCRRRAYISPQQSRTATSALAGASAGLGTLMPYFFFDIQDGVEMIDDVGTECTDLEEAQREAVKAATEILGSSGHDLWSGETWIMKVREGSMIVAELSFTARKVAKAAAVSADELGLV